MDEKLLQWECTDCEIEFEAKKKADGYLPDCPKCKIDYRVYQLKTQ